MKLFVSFTFIIAVVSASQIYYNPQQQYINPQPQKSDYANQQVENYAKSAEVYQSALEHQQQGVYFNQPAPVASTAQHQSRPHEEKKARILSYLSDNNGHNYQYSYETENGISTQEVGAEQGKGVEVHGAYSYVGDDGHAYTVSYTADENGFRPKGDHLPTPPPIPEAILKSLEQNAKDEAAGIFDEGAYGEPTYHLQQKQQEQHQELQNQYYQGHLTATSASGYQ